MKNRGSGAGGANTICGKLFEEKTSIENKLLEKNSKK